MIKKKGVPISGGSGQWGFTPNVPTNAADTSRDAMKKLRGSPQPFQNREGILGIPAPTEKTNRANSNFAKDGMRFGGTGKSVSVRSKPTVDLSAVGEPRLPKGYNPISSGFPLSAQRVSGAISTNRGPQANAKEVRRLKQTYPGLGIGKWRP